MGNAVATGAVDRGLACKGRELGMEKIPVDRYVSDEYYEREKDAIWRNSWLWIGRASDIPNPGDFFKFDLHVLSTSILVVRGKDHKIRAFYNSCKHRGAPVVFDSTGSCKALTCSFHGWVYDLDGKNLHITMEHAFDNLDKSKIALKPIPVDLWGGFIFVNLNPNPEHSLKEWMKPLPDQLDEYFANEKWVWRYGYKEVFRCNWKILIDVQIEGYHVNSLHRSTITGFFSDDDMPTTAYPNSLGMPGKLEWCMPSSERGEIKQTRVAQLAVKYGKDAPYTDKHAAATLQSAAEKYPGALNLLNRPDWIFDDYAVFPNTVIFPQRDHVWIQRVWPLGPHKTAWEWDWYFIGEPENFGELFSWEQACLTLRNITTEDVTTVEGMQKSYRSGAVDGMILSGLEIAVRGFENRITELIEGKGTDGSENDRS